MRHQHVPASAANRGQSLLNSRYAVLEEVGRGAYGLVFKGKDSTTGELVAIKEVKLTGSTQEHLQEVMGEIDLLKSLNHDHIVKYLDSFKTRTHLYIILEFMEKGDLSSTLKRDNFGVFPESLAAVYIAQVLQGLAYLHEQGVVHRDIKGANILTTSEGLVKLADFGVATSLQDHGGGGSVDVVGTPYWMAPEVIEMTEVTAASDVWSVGCLVIELLTGHPPYYDFQPMSALFRIVQDIHPPLPEGITTQMEDFLLQCFNKEARQRPDARMLLGHAWIRTNKSRRNIRATATWSRTQGNRSSMGGAADKPKMHESVLSVVDRILKTTESDPRDEDLEAAGPLLDSNSRAVPQAKSEYKPNSPYRTNRKSLSSPSVSPRGPTTLAVETGFGSVTGNPLRAARSLGGNGTDARSTDDAGTWGGPGSPDWNAEDQIGDGELTPARALQERDVAFSPTRPRLPRLSGPGPSELEERMGMIQPSALGPVARLLWRMGGGHGQVGTPVGAQGGDLLSWALAGGMGGAEGGAGGVTARTPTRGPPPQGGGGFGYDPTVSPGPQQMVAPSPVAGNITLEDGQDRLAEMRRDKEEVRRLILQLRVEQPAPPSSELAVLNACQRLLSMLGSSQDCKAFFLESAGVAAILELLDTNNPKIIEAVLELVNSMANQDVAILEALTLMGVVPAITKFAARAYNTALRHQAAQFMQQLCFAAPQTQQMLIACNGLPVLVKLVEVDYKAHRDLVFRAVSCIWSILESQGPGGGSNDFCRMLAHHGLVERLVSSLSSASLERAQSHTDSHIRSPSMPSPPTGQSVPLMELDHHDREASNGRASSTDGRSLPASIHNRGKRGSNLSVGSDYEIHYGRGVQVESKMEASRLMEKTSNLLLVFSIADSVVKKHLCRQETLQQLFDTVPQLEPPTMLKVLRCIKHLTMDENVVFMLQEGDTIKQLVTLLNSMIRGGAGSAAGSPSPRTGSPGSPLNSGLLISTISGATEEHQLEVVHAVYNLCRVNKQCQERAAVEGCVRSLCHLAQRDSALHPRLRTLAISMLCRLAHASSASRGQLWQASALTIFLRLLSESRWQAPAMDAIATWLTEDLVRIEPRLLQSENADQITSVFDKWKQQLHEGTGVGELKGLLEIFYRILATSRRLNIILSSGRLPALVVAMLREERPMTSLPLLKILRCLYEAHPHPKEFIIQHGIHKAVHRLAVGEKTHKMALVAKQAQNLLDAFQINSIL